MHVVDHVARRIKLFIDKEFLRGKEYIGGPRKRKRKKKWKTKLRAISRRMRIRTRCNLRVMLKFAYVREGIKRNKQPFPLRGKIIFAAW